MRRICTWLLIPTVAICLLADRVGAYPNFWKEFEAEYIENHKNEEWVAAEVRNPETKFQECLMCHQGKNRKNHNAFGNEIKSRLDGAKDNRALSGKRRDPEGYEKVREKVIAVFKEVCAMPVDPRNPDGETYGDRLAAGKWPGGELEELKKDPPKE